MSTLTDLKKTLIPIQQGMEQHRAAICAEFKARHDRHMMLSRKVQELQKSPPAVTEVEALLSEFLESYVDKARVEFARCAAPWRYAQDCQEGMESGRKIALQMLRDDPALSALVMIAAPALRAAIPAAARSLGWEFGPEPAARETALANLQAQQAALTQEFEAVIEVATSVGLRSEDLPR